MGLVWTQGTAVKDISGTIAVNATSQALMAANPERRGFYIQNTSAASLWINDLSAAATMSPPCLEIKAGALYESPIGGASQAAITIIGATAGQAWAGREW